MSKDSSQVDSDDGDIDFEELERQLQGSIKRIIKATKANPRPKTISQQSKPRYGRLHKFRKSIAIAGIIAAPIATFVCFAPSKMGMAVSIISVVVGALAITELCAEVILGAGAIVQSQWEAGNVTWREIHFRPSLNRITPVIATLVLGTSLMTVGYAGIYSEIGLIAPDSFNLVPAGFASIYFSVVTATTVGFGDFFPKTVTAQCIVVTQIILTWLITVIGISTLVSWIVTQTQLRMAKIMGDEERDMQYVEQLLRTTKQGLYRSHKGPEEK
jgi:voltage-gated potassium channel